MALKICVLCGIKLFDHVERCSCGSLDFEQKKEEIPIDLYGKSKIYVLLPDGTRDYISALVVKIFKPRVGDRTIMGYPIMEDK